MAIEITSPMAGDKLKTELEKALDKTGDSMADGASLVLGKMPEQDMEAVPKIYVDNFADYLYKDTDLFIKRDKDGNILYTDYEETLDAGQVIVEPVNKTYYEMSTPQKLCKINFSKYTPHYMKIKVGLVGYDTFYGGGNSGQWPVWTADTTISLRDKDDNIIFTKRTTPKGGSDNNSHLSNGYLFFSASEPTFTIDMENYQNESLYLWLDYYRWTVVLHTVEGSISLNLNSLEISVDDRWKIDFGKTVV